MKKKEYNVKKKEGMLVQFIFAICHVGRSVTELTSVVEMALLRGPRIKHFRGQLLERIDSETGLISNGSVYGTH